MRRDLAIMLGIALRSQVSMWWTENVIFQKVRKSKNTSTAGNDIFSLKHPYIRLLCGRKLHTVLFYLFRNNREAHVAHDIIFWVDLCIMKHLVHICVIGAGGIMESRQFSAHTHLGKLCVNCVWMRGYTAYCS